MVSLFNTIAKHQKAVAVTAASEQAKVKEARETAEIERLRPSATSHSFLDLLHQNVKPAAHQQHAGDEGTAPGTSKGSKWAVLSDNFLTSKKGAESIAAREDDEDEVPDILDSDSE